MDLLPDAAASRERVDLPILGSATEVERRNLGAFDEMDFNVFSRRDWARFHESHAQDIRVHFPDGKGGLIPPTGNMHQLGLA